jgi:acyl-CoA thioesterase
MTRFDTDTALRRVADGVYEGTVDRGWWIVRGPNGGYLAATLLRGMVMEVDDPARSPRSLTVHYTRPASEGPVRVEAAIERSGRTLSTVSARMIQDDKLIALGVGAFAGAYKGYEFADLPMPEVPAPEDVEPVIDREDFPFGWRFDFRPFTGAADRAESWAWMRLREPRLLDAPAAVMFMDAWAPAVFAKVGNAAPGVPTIDMTFHLRRPLPLSEAAPDDWYLGVFRTTTSHEGFIEEDGWLWSRSGVLVGQSRQLALLLAR